MVNAGDGPDQLHPLQTRMSVPADDDVVVHGNAERGGDLDDHLGHMDIGLRRRGGVFGDKTLRVNDASGATLDIIEPPAARARDQPKLGGR